MDLATTKLRKRSVPHVGTDRLLARLSHLHDRLHTAAGLHAHDAPRRDLVDNGLIVMAIAAELRARGVASGIDCRFCAT